jgi:hypothetical protein
MQSLLIKQSPLIEVVADPVRMRANARRPGTVTLSMSVTLKASGRYRARRLP